MPLLGWLMGRLRTVQKQEQDAARRHRRTEATVDAAQQAQRRADRLAQEMRQMGKVL